MSATASILTELFSVNNQLWSCGDEDASLKWTGWVGHLARCDWAKAGNYGLKALELMLNNPKMFWLRLRMHLDISHLDKTVPGRIKCDIHLVTARPAFVIKTAAQDGQVHVLYKSDI